MAFDKEQIKPVMLRGLRVYPFHDADDLIDYADSQKGVLVAVNAQKMLDADEQMATIMNNNIAYCDGEWVCKAARQKGASPQKIAGCELWLKIIERFHASRTFYLIGAKPEVHDAMIAKLTSEFPDIKIVGHRDGYIKSQQERQALIDDVVRTAPDFVFVAMGSPTQEVLMTELNNAHSAVYQGLGGSFDVYTGYVKRAPIWWQKHNLEAIYRLIKQPRRIKKNIKYLIFVWWIINKKF